MTMSRHRDGRGRLIGARLSHARSSADRNCHALTQLLLATGGCSVAATSAGAPPDMNLCHQVAGWRADLDPFVTVQDATRR
jgi:hypothetical protein